MNITKVQLTNPKYQFLCVLLSCLIFTSYSFAQENQHKFSGITMVAPPSPIDQTSLGKIASVNAAWVCLVPYGFIREGGTDVRYNLNFQWWGEKEEGIVESIRLAKSEGLKVMLKPQIYMHGKWIGDLAYTNEKDWLAFEKSYKAFIMHWSDIAEKENVELFCVGTEIKLSAQQREAYWRELIEEVKADYCGLLCYSSNWDAYEQVPFWDALDFVGVSAYFPLSEKKTPNVKQLKNAWSGHLEELKRFSELKNKQILFTEYGYLTVDGCAGKTWELEKKIQSLAKNEQAQANAIEALLAKFSEEAFWAGGFLWKWFPDGMGHEGYPDKDYDPQGKKAENVLKEWYGKMNDGNN